MLRKCCCRYRRRLIAIVEDDVCVIPRRRLSRWTSIPSDYVNATSLYLNVLREAKRYPSVKRDAVVEEIRRGFREYRDEKDPLTIQRQVDIAVNGLAQLRQFTRRDMSSPNWQYRTFQNPVTAARDAESQRQAFLTAAEKEERRRIGGVASNIGVKKLRDGSADMETNPPPSSS